MTVPARSAKLEQRREWAASQESAHTVPVPVPGMGLIPHTQMNEQEARAITQEIQDRVADLTVLVVRAFKGEAHTVLGYTSWADYIKAEFNDAPLYLPRDDRRAVVQVLRGHGMSTRNIASVTGVDQKTIVNDMNAREENSSPGDDRTAGPQTIKGEDGKRYPAQRKPKPAPQPEPTVNAEIVDAEIVEDTKPKPKPVYDADDTKIAPGLTERGHLLYVQESATAALASLADGAVVVQQPVPAQPKKRLTKFDSTEMLANINGMLNGIIESIPFIDPADIDAEENEQVINNIRQSMGGIIKLLGKIENQWNSTDLQRA